MNPGLSIFNVNPTDRGRWTLLVLWEKVEIQIGVRVLPRSLREILSRSAKQHEKWWVTANPFFDTPPKWSMNTGVASALEQT